MAGETPGAQDFTSTITVLGPNGLTPYSKVQVVGGNTHFQRLMLEAMGTDQYILVPPIGEQPTDAPRALYRRTGPTTPIAPLQK